MKRKKLKKKVKKIRKVKKKGRKKLGKVKKGKVQKLDSYKLVVDEVPVTVEIIRYSKDFVPLYKINVPHAEAGTEAVLNAIRSRLVSEIKLTPEELTNVRVATDLEAKFKNKIIELLKKEFPRKDPKKVLVLAGHLMHESFGFGPIEFMIEDPQLEEIVVHDKDSLIWVYHKKYGWLKTNINLEKGVARNYSSKIARQVGRQITILCPLLDAHLLTGDRINAVLYPISTFGDEITIRKFRRDPLTVVDLIKENTISLEIVSFIWLMMQSEMSIIFSGGTASGKTTIMNSCMSFIPANNRIISIEETRELLLPNFLHWEPLVTRPPNAEGKGEIAMLDLLVNSLRMRPDRIIVGEIRRKREAETLFEAMHTGHAVYATMHADTAEQTIRRLSHPPIDIPRTVLETLPLIVTIFRNRRKNIRRIFQIAEVIPGKDEIRTSSLWKWNPRNDKFEKVGMSKRAYAELKMHTGMSNREIRRDLLEKQKILKWMIKNDIRDVNDVGKVINVYYSNKVGFFKTMNKKDCKERILKGEVL